MTLSTINSLISWQSCIQLEYKNACVHLAKNYFPKLYGGQWPVGLRPEAKKDMISRAISAICQGIVDNIEILAYN